MGTRHQNIGTLKHGIPDQAKWNGLIGHIRRACHIFHTGQPRHAGQGYEHLKKQIHLVHSVNGRLQINGRFFWIYAHGQIIQYHLIDIFTQRIDVFFLRLCGQHVQVGHQKIALVLILQGHAVLQRPNIVPQMQTPRGPIPCQNSLFIHKFKG